MMTCAGPVPYRCRCAVICRDGTPRGSRLQRRQLAALRLLDHQDPALQEVHPRDGQPGRLAEPQPGAGAQRHGNAIPARERVSQREHRGGRERLDFTLLYPWQRNAGARVNRDYAVIDRGGHHRPHHPEHRLDGRG
jgi:hypothetical protein